MIIKNALTLLLALEMGNAVLHRLFPKPQDFRFNSVFVKRCCRFQQRNIRTPMFIRAAID